MLVRVVFVLFVGWYAAGVLLVYWRVCGNTGMV